MWRGYAAAVEHAFEGPQPVAAQRAVRVAVIDDDQGFVTVLVKRLTALGWPHRVLASPVPVDALMRMRLDALIVDPVVLAPHAWTYLESVCGELPTLGVIACTGRTSVAQRVRGFRTGVDDWVTKPCHPEEVIARVEAVVRRRRRAERPEQVAPVALGELEVRADAFEVLAGGVPAELTRREFEVFKVLVGADGRVLAREEIYRLVWGYDMVPGDRSVDVFVRKVRAKLERVSPAWRYIHTHHGVGYRLVAEPVT